MFVKYMVVTAILFRRDSMLSYRVEYKCYRLVRYTGVLRACRCGRHSVERIDIVRRIHESLLSIYNRVTAGLEGVHLVFYAVYLFSVFIYLVV